jgi:energy-coupling factor transport system substrate-specific component
MHCLVVVAPVLDILIYRKPVNLVFTQGVTAAFMNIVSAGRHRHPAAGTYARHPHQEGSLAKKYLAL